MRVRQWAVMPATPCSGSFILCTLPNWSSTASLIGNFSPRLDHPGSSISVKEICPIAPCATICESCACRRRPRPSATLSRHRREMQQHTFSQLPQLAGDLDDGSMPPAARRMWAAQTRLRRNSVWTVNQDLSSQTDQIDALTRRLQRHCALRFAPGFDPTMTSAFSSKSIDVV
jgi:hypothetical protein